MQVNKWGPHGWYFLHTITFNYTPTDESRVKYKTFFEMICSVLPCRYCCESFGKYSKAIPIDEYLDSREGLTYWLYVIHNLVNQKICHDLKDFKEVVIQYEKIRAKCGTITTANEVQVKTCQIKQQENIDNEFIEKFIQITYDKYREKTAAKIKAFFDDPSNPNFESLNVYCKHAKI